MAETTRSVADALTLAGAVLGTLLLTGGGLAIERAGVQNLLAGQSMLGAWEVGMGALAVFVGLYLLGYKQVYLRLQGDARTA